jgi:hydrogenase maturation protease
MPGSELRFREPRPPRGDRIPSAFSNKLSPHQHGINDLLAILTFVDRAPARVVLHGVPRGSSSGWTSPPEISAALPELAARVVAEVTTYASARRA